MINKRFLLLCVLFLYSPFLLGKNYYISTSKEKEENEFLVSDINVIIPEKLDSGDSILFERGSRYYTNINFTKTDLENIYVGSYGNIDKSNPVIDGSIIHFKFCTDSVKRFIIKNGIKFYGYPLSTFAEIKNVFSDNRMLTLAREPDEEEEIVSGMKNSYKGFYKIDSIDINQAKRSFYDYKNKHDWSGGQVVTKSNNFTHEVTNVMSWNKGHFILDKDLIRIVKNNGYFIQNHFDALDSKNEWYYDKEKKLLFLSENNNNSQIYISGMKNEQNQGIINISNSKNITIENLTLTNGYIGIQINNSKNIKIRNNVILNSCIGIDFFRYNSLNDGEISGNEIKNIRSYAIHGKGNNNRVSGNKIHNIGMTYGCNAGGVYNLEGITLVGDKNRIDNNYISRIGFNGIKIYYGGNGTIENNIIDSCGLRLSDAGGIYSWHSFEGSKLIKNNIISNVSGDNSGTTDPAKHHGRGIYLDELSLHFKIENNEIFRCGEGIYVQNSRNDTIIGNKCYNNYNSELYMNSGGSILNGGVLNPVNDIYFDPDTLSRKSLAEYVWDKNEGLIYKKNKDHTVFVEPKNNLIENNSIIPSDTTFTFVFRTWREVDNNTLEELTSNSDFINNNLLEGVSYEKASLLMSSSNVWVPAQGKKVYMVGKADVNRSEFPKLREFKTEVIIGTKH